MTVDDPGKGLGVDQGQGGDSKGPLISVRALLILTVAGVVGVLSGLTAGVSAGLAVTAGASAGWGLAAGLISGFAATAISTLLTAAGLHALIGGKD